MVPRGKQRVILAMLLLNAGQVVRLDELAETLWVSGLPPSGPVAVQNYVMRLRKTLGDAGRARIITHPPGYLIRVQDRELDLSRAETLLGAAREAAQDGSWDQAATLAREALQLWRGDPLTDVDSETLAAREAPRLTELRLQTLELRIDADLHLGRQAQVITELRQLTGAHSLREHLHGQLMLALCRDGRRAEALAAYRHARDVMVTELGVEPGPGLRELQQRILSADPALAAADRAPGVSQRAPGTGTSLGRPARAGPRRGTPRQLPSVMPGFTGRAVELQTLTQNLDEARGEPGGVAISAIGGTAGAGQTTLALHPVNRRRRPPPYRQTRPAQRHTPRVPTCRLTSTDVIFGKNKAVARKAHGDAAGTRAPVLGAGNASAAIRAEVAFVALVTIVRIRSYLRSSNRLEPVLRL